MDRPSQKPPERPGSHPEAGESPLSFPVEAPKLADVEPGAGEPLSFRAETAKTSETAASPLAFPAEVASPPADPLAFPTPAPPSADPLAFPTSAPPPAEQLPFPVAELPGSVTAVPPPQPPTPTPEPAPIAATEAQATPGLRRFLPPALTAVAAVMAAGGCFLPLFRLEQHVSVRQRFFDAQLTVTQTAWDSRIEIPGQDVTEQAAAPVGIPLILAVILLVAAAYTAFARPERSGSRWLIAAGAVFTAGVVSTVGMIGPGWAAMADGMDLEVSTVAGMWLLIGATVLAAAAAVLAYLPGRRTGDDWADPVLAYADTPTPPTGVAITVLPPEEPGQPG